MLQAICFLVVLITVSGLRINPRRVSLEPLRISPLEVCEEGAFWSYPDDCSWFFYCHNGEIGSGDCGEGLYFDPIQIDCLPSDEVDCKVEEDKEDKDKPDFPDCNTGANFIKPHPWNCNWFIYCSNGIRSVQNCPHLYHYDIIQHRCVFMRNAVCITDK